MAAGMFYWMAPRLWKTELWSKSLANFHFWIALVGILLYVGAMWTAGIMQGLMLGELNEQGTGLKYEFIETVKAIQLPYILRTIGGTLYLVGFLLCAFNIWKTARSGVATNGTAEVNILDREKKDFLGLKAVFAHKAVQHIFCVILFTILWIFAPRGGDYAALALVIVFSWLAVRAFRRDVKSWSDFHDRLLENYIPLTVLAFIAVAIGGAVQIIPTLMVDRAKNIEGRLQEIYTPLELAGRDLYIDEGCYNCHSQMIRTLVPDVLRYGDGAKDDYSHLGESIYDFPHQWGSKRTGPDLAREGGPASDDAKFIRSGKRDNLWHFNHFLDPRQTSPGSNMPPYPWFFREKIDFKSLPGRIAVQRRLGVPYPTMTQHEIEQNAREQALAIADSLKDSAFLPDREDLTGDELRTYLADRKIIAMIAYMQKLGTYEAQSLDKKKPDTFDPDQHRKYRYGDKEIETTRK
jgi:cytochrome c oxidase cbb3-type subunit I/II